MEQTELQKAFEEIESLKARVTTLESLINGCSPKRAGRNHKLSLEQRGDIIQKHNHGMSYSVLAKEYAVSKSTICNICRGRLGSCSPEKGTTYLPIYRTPRSQ